MIAASFKRFTERSNSSKDSLKGSDANFWGSVKMLTDLKKHLRRNMLKMKKFSKFCWYLWARKTFKEFKSRYNLKLVVVFGSQWECDISNFSSLYNPSKASSSKNLPLNPSLTPFERIRVFKWISFSKKSLKEARLGFDVEDKMRLFKDLSRIPRKIQLL